MAFATLPRSFAPQPYLSTELNTIASQRGSDSIGLCNRITYLNDLQVTQGMSCPEKICLKRL
jgi:hypothetical protein